MYEWYEMGKMSWEQIYKYIDDECLKKGLSLPEEIMDKPVEPKDVNESPGYYLYKVSNFRFKDKDIATKYIEYLQSLIENKELIDSYRDTYIQEDSYEIRLQKEYIKAEPSKEYKQSKEYIQYMTNMEIYENQLELYNKLKNKYTDYAYEIRNEYENFRMIYSNYLIVKNAFKKSLDIIEDFDKTVEVIKTQFLDIDIDEKEEFFNMIKFEFENK